MIMRQSSFLDPLKSINSSLSNRERTYTHLGCQTRHRGALAGPHSLTSKGKHDNSPTLQENAKKSKTISILILDDFNYFGRDFNISYINY